MQWPDLKNLACYNITEDVKKCDEGQDSDNSKNLPQKEKFSTSHRNN